MAKRLPNRTHPSHGGGGDQRSAGSVCLLFCWEPTCSDYGVTTVDGETMQVLGHRPFTALELIEAAQAGLGNAGH